MAKIAIGIDLGGTTAKFGVFNEGAELIDQWFIPTRVDEKGSQIVPDIIESLSTYLATHQYTSQDVIGIGMGSPGNVDSEAGTVTGAYNLNWRETQFVRRQIEGALQIPFVIENDANCAALGERWQGAGENDENVVFVTLGTGVGGGIIANGQLVNGASGAAGEIGHMTVDLNGPLCTCGKVGCLEALASATGIVQLAKEDLEGFEGASILSQLIAEDRLESKEIFDAAKEGDALANQVVDRFSGYLGLALSHLANSLNPAYIVLGGGVSKAGDFLLDRVSEKFLKHVFPPIAGKTSIKIAKLGNDAGIIGAVSLVLH